MYIYRERCIWMMIRQHIMHVAMMLKRRLKTRQKLVLVIANNQIRKNKIKFIDTFNDDPVHRRGSFLSFMLSSGFAIAP